mgnify:CR=1 FL=1
MEGSSDLLKDKIALEISLIDCKVSLGETFWGNKKNPF